MPRDGSWRSAELETEGVNARSKSRRLPQICRRLANNGATTAETMGDPDAFGIVRLTPKRQPRQGRWWCRTRGGQAFSATNQLPKPIPGCRSEPPRGAGSDGPAGSHLPITLGERRTSAKRESSCVMVRGQRLPLRNLDDGDWCRCLARCLGTDRTDYEPERSTNGAEVWCNHARAPLQL